MDNAEIYKSGILNKGEEVKYCFRGNEIEERIKGLLVLTNKRLLFLTKPSGWGAKGLSVNFTYPWNSVLSVSTSGLVFKRLNVNCQREQRIIEYVFSSDEVENSANKIVACKNNCSEETTIEAQKVIIEEVPKEKAMAILQKRLARGEITLAEFNKLITRT